MNLKPKIWMGSSLKIIIDSCLSYSTCVLHNNLNKNINKTLPWIKKSLLKDKLLCKLILFTFNLLQCFMLNTESEKDVPMGNVSYLTSLPSSSSFIIIIIIAVVFIIITILDKIYWKNTTQRQKYYRCNLYAW